MVLDAYSRTYTSEFSKLEAYANGLMKSSPGSKVVVELSRDELRENMKGVQKNVCLITYMQKGLESWLQGYHRSSWMFFKNII